MKKRAKAIKTPFSSNARKTIFIMFLIAATLTVYGIANGATVSHRGEEIEAPIDATTLSSFAWSEIRDSTGWKADVIGAGSKGNITTTASGNITIGTTNKQTVEVTGRIKGTEVIFKPSTPPANPEKGSLYFDNNENGLKYYDGSGWKDFSGGGGGTTTTYTMSTTSYKSGISSYAGIKSYTCPAGSIPGVSISSVTNYVCPGETVNRNLCTYQISGSSITLFAKVSTWHSNMFPSTNCFEENICTPDEGSSWEITCQKVPTTCSLQFTCGTTVVI